MVKTYARLNVDGKVQVEKEKKERQMREEMV